MKALENIMLEELEKALAGDKHELKEAIETLANSFKMYREKVAAYEVENPQIVAKAEELAGSLLQMTQILKDMHIWLGSVRDKFPIPDKDYAGYKDIMEVLGLFVMSSGAIKAGVVEHARSDD